MFCRAIRSNNSIRDPPIRYLPHERRFTQCGLVHAPRKVRVGGRAACQLAPSVTQVRLNSQLDSHEAIRAWSDSDKQLSWCPSLCPLVSRIRLSAQPSLCRIRQVGRWQVTGSRRSSRQRRQSIYGWFTFRALMSHQ